MRCSVSVVRVLVRVCMRVRELVRKLVWLVVRYRVHRHGMGLHRRHECIPEPELGLLKLVLLLLLLKYHCLLCCLFQCLFLTSPLLSELFEFCEKENNAKVCQN